MKVFITFFITFLICNFQAYSQEPIPSALNFLFADTDNQIHDLDDYLSEGKPVFLFEFSNEPASYLAHESLNLEELYNTYGQGGSNEVVVLYLASYGFENEEDLSNLDYSDSLGIGYEAVSFLENNPIPLGIIAQNPNTLYYDSAATLYGFCPNDVFFTSIGPQPEDYMAALFNNCCGGSVPDDPGLYDNSPYFIADCNPQELNFQIVNYSPIQMDSTSIGISINNQFVEDLFYAGTIGGCKAVDYSYTNQSIQIGDTITAFISQENQQTNNDTIYIPIEPVDTVRGQIRVDIINPASEDAYGVISYFPQGYAEAKLSSNWWNQLFYNSQSGCQQLGYYYSEESLAEGEALMVTSLNADETIQDTLVYITGSFIHGASYRRNLFIEATVPYYSTGYIFENINNDVFYNPEYPPISRMKISAGTFTTFSEEDGFYKLYGYGLPLDPDNSDEVWPELTAGTTNFTIYNSQRNLGFNATNQVWNIETTFQNGSPVSCDNENFKQSIHLFNNGNMTASGEFVFTHDPILTVDSCVPPPVSISSNELVFEYSDLPQSGKEDFQIFYHNVGIDLTSQFMNSDIVTTAFENNVPVFEEANHFNDTIFCSNNPDNIYGYPLGIGEYGIIPDTTEKLTFRIQFQNNSDDTVKNMFISQIIPNELNWESIQLGDCSHNVRVEMNSINREMRFTLKDIDLPSSNVNVEGSKGVIWYSAKLNDLNPGDQILNSATVWMNGSFNFTNISIHTISNIVSVDEVELKQIIGYPNPVINQVHFDFGNINFLKSAVFFDSNGKKVKQTNISAQKVDIDVSGLAAGTYNILFFDSNNVRRLQSTLVKIK